jgi:hypothetical protein
MINLPKFSRIDSLKNFLMPEVYWGSAICLLQKKSIVLTLLDFPNPEQAHRSSTIDGFLWILSMSIPHVLCRR